jgi:diguanylate cyclase (GGDEF)-like protein/PAS domain S-box-containing protein
VRRTGWVEVGSTAGATPERSHDHPVEPDAATRPAQAPPEDPRDLLWAAMAATDALVVVVGTDGRALFTSPSMTRATGWTEADLARRPHWEVFVAPEDVENARDAHERAVGLGLAFPQEGDWLDRSGGRRRVSILSTVLPDASGRPYAVVFVAQDVTEQRRAEAALRRRADTDPLTGLDNRGRLFEALTGVLADENAGGCGLLFCDLDGFKQVNDAHGHHVGDLLLVELAARLRRVAGAGDVVARLGGDEFVVLSPGSDRDRLAVLAERVEQALSRPVTVPSGVVRVGVSVGTSVGSPGADPDVLVRIADRRMYRVKSARRALR